MQKAFIFGMLTVMAVLILEACAGPPNAGNGPNLGLTENGSIEKGVARQATSPKACLTPIAQRAWNNRSLSLKASEEELQNRATESAMREIGQPITARTNIVGSTLRQFGQIVGAAEPICGNWCGAGRRYTDSMAQPVVDQLDDACRKHEQCTLSHGLGFSRKQASCRCDQSLADEILRGRNLVSLSENEKSVIMWLQGQPCSGGCKTIAGVQACGS